MLGESGKRWKGASPSLSIGHQAMESFKGHQTMEPSKGHQVMEPSIGHRVGIFLHLLHFSLSLKEQIKIICGCLFLGHNFLFESWKYMFPQPSLGRKEWLVLVDGEKRENKLDVCSTFEKWKWIGIMLGAWNLRTKFTNLFKFGNTASY